MTIDHENVQDEYTKWIGKATEGEDDADYAGGGETVDVEHSQNYESELLAHPDQSQYAALLSTVRTAIRQEIDRERKFLDNLNSQAIRVTSNLSGQVSFMRYTVPANQAIQIVREKNMRGNLTIVNFTDTVMCYIGLHSGIMVGGTDTVAVYGATAGVGRTIRTRRALFAIASVACNIDVQEEFD